ncbi:SAM-dependent methyltransferase [Aliidiomarina iranensis]|uniref:tRNA (guanine(46)-N(7))-methyltransferase n=1 Tax=Aliidiomarina iranensis TaxID=1434071 RepID=A0A432VV09_9GAMM|nr:SAM-dependent methyltransferase [Aliidiomarina iranensis]
MANSRVISSNQGCVHSDIPRLVGKYWQGRFLKPVAEHSAEAFAEVNRKLTDFNGPLILDSCCGVGESTAEIAKRNPHALVVGVDKSAHRLSKHVHQSQSGEGQYLLVRADLNDFWRLAREAEWQPEKHFLLYPNPWPKKKHLGRRWHGAPVFPEFVRLGGAIDLRSNWPIYLQEFALALRCCGISAKVTKLAVDIEPVTPFERKYQASKQELWQLTADLAGADLIAPAELAQLTALAETDADVLKSAPQKIWSGDARGT